MKCRNGTGKSWKGRSEIGVDSEGTLTIKEGVTLKSKNDYYYCNIIDNKQGTINVEGGTIDLGYSSRGIYNEPKVLKEGIKIDNGNEGNGDKSFETGKGNLYVNNYYYTNSYSTIKLDMRGKTGTYTVELGVIFKNNPYSNGKFYATITDSEELVKVNETEGQFVNTTETIELSSTKEYTTEIEGGQVYYLQLGSYGSRTYVNNIEVYNAEGDTLELYDKGEVNITDVTIGNTNYTDTAILNQGKLNMTGGTINCLYNGIVVGASIDSDGYVGFDGCSESNISNTNISNIHKIPS